MELHIMTATACEQLANHYKSLSRESGISPERASLLMNIGKSFTGLATQLDRLAALMRDEARAG
ncbi:hypothetical protein E4K65_33990 [Bradyrhizobium niftali]|uniref:Uncharacterized protein n=1 Tax=Bradyrhizobium niftali TaxID=2560055 RepID=A0A4Y9LIA0_9BRAD|nr:hypothetical protein E4K65_33990 [Bradyrhizobium niftali]